MTIDDVKLSIKNHILNSISHRDICTLCNIFAIPIDTRRKYNQRNVLDSILLSTDLILLQHILLMLNKTDREGNTQASIQPANQNYSHNVRFSQPQSNNMNFSLNLRLYCLSSELIKQCPIDLKSEIVPGVNPQNIFVPNYTKYPDGFFNAPSCPPALINGRMNMPNVQLPYVSKNTTIKTSPFYCCQVVLHPLSLLIPKPTPNICQPNRVMSKMQLNFTLSSSVRQLITANRCQNNNKNIYKWQVLLRFGVYDPVVPFPSHNNDIGSLTEYIPPYLTISVNGFPVQLWDILPSNTASKEGKRHSRPINISDYIRYVQVDDRGYRQIINVNWWQTPGVYLYYYAAVFLERKLDVKELLNQFIKRTHSIQKPITFTMDFICEKFSTNNQFHKILENDENEDDLIISSVLPVSLLCPVGKSRIICPLRSINCQHLQCFDAHLYLMMNERRSVWKCPVCDCQATLNELFVDEYFQKILTDFNHNEEITEVNVNPDGTYVAVAVKESRDDKKHANHIASNVEKTLEINESVNNCSNGNSTESQPVILLESDDDESNNLSKCELTPRAIICQSDIGGDKVIENNPLNTQFQGVKNSSAIDLTSDSDDDVEVPNLNILSINSSNNSNSVAFGNSPQSLLDIHGIPNLVQMTTKQPEPNNQSVSAINENHKVSNSTFHRIPINCPLLLPGNNMLWIPNANYPLIYQQDNANKFNSQSQFTNNKPIKPFGLQSTPAIINNKTTSNLIGTNRLLDGNSLIRPSNKVSIQPNGPIRCPTMPSTQPNGPIRCPTMPSTQPNGPIKCPSIPSMSGAPTHTFSNISAPSISNKTNLETISSRLTTSLTKIASKRDVPQPFSKSKSSERVPPIKISLKTDPYNSSEQLFFINKTSISSQPSVSSKRPKKQCSREKLRPRPSGARTSTRLQRQSKKTYVEDSGSSNDDSNLESDISTIGDYQRLKRNNPFDDSESSCSDLPNKKRKRLLLEQSDDEEDSVKSMIINKIISNPNFPIICLTRLDEDVLKRYLSD